MVVDPFIRKAHDDRAAAGCRAHIRAVILRLNAHGAGVFLKFCRGRLGKGHAPPHAAAVFKRMVINIRLARVILRLRQRRSQSADNRRQQHT